MYRQMELVGLASLQEAAEACGLDKAALWRYFSWDVRPLVGKLPMLCRGLQVPLNELPVLRLVNRASVLQILVTRRI